MLRSLCVWLAALALAAFGGGGSGGETLASRMVSKGIFSGLAAISATLGGAPLPPSPITQRANQIVTGPLPQISAARTLVVGVAS